MNSSAAKLITYFGIASAVVNPALIFAPILLGGAVSTLGFSTAEAVSIVSGELLVTALASIPALWWVAKLRWRYVALLGTLLVCVGNLLSLFCNNADSLLIVRLVTGFFEGTLLALYMAVVAQTEHPERVFGGKIAVQMLVGAVGLAVFPIVIDAWGLKAVYALLGVASLGLLFNLNNIFADQHKRVTLVGSRSFRKPKRWGYTSLLILFVFGAGANMLWAFLERIGTLYGFSLVSVGYIMSASLLVAIVCGAVCASVGTRFGRLLPVAVGLMLGVSGALLLLFGSSSVACFIAGVCFISIARVVPAPYLFGFVAMLDRKGRLAVMSHIAIAAGMSLGPVLAHLLIGWQGIPAMLMVGALLLTATCLIAVKIDTISKHTQSPLTVQNNAIR